MLRAALKPLHLFVSGADQLLHPEALHCGRRRFAVCCQWSGGFALSQMGEQNLAAGKVEGEAFWLETIANFMGSCGG